MLATALLFAALIDIIRVPKVTAYLLLGMLVGSHGFELISEETMHRFATFERMAMALVLLNLGARFPISQLGGIKKLIPLSLGEQLATMAVVSLGLWTVTSDTTTAILLGALALATAPATTVLVLKEVQSRGPVTEFTNGLVVLNNLTCIVLFETLLLVFLGADSVGSATVLLVWRFLGAIVLGFAVGIAVSYFSGLLASKKWLVLMVASSALLLGICDFADFPYMLAFLVMGAVVASFSTEAKSLILEIDNLTTLLCVVFFVYHGTELDVRAFFAAGLVGIAYIGCRVIGKYLGIFASARLTKQPVDVQNWLGTTLLAQAGAAIALCAIAVERSPTLGHTLQTIILGSVVFFEIVGPMCIRWGVLQSGEVPIAQAFYHVGHTPIEQGKALWSRLAASFAGGMINRSIDQLSVADLMQASQSITDGASFDLVIDHIEHSHDDVFPVVDKNGVAVGIIRYTAINTVLFDPHAVDLICAEDLMEPLDRVLRKSDHATHAIEYLRSTQDDCVVVTDDEEPHPFIGVVRRSHITALLIEERKTAQS